MLARARHVIARRGVQLLHEGKLEHSLQWYSQAAETGEQEVNDSIVRYEALAAEISGLIAPEVKRVAIEYDKEIEAIEANHPAELAALQHFAERCVAAEAAAVAGGGSSSRDGSRRDGSAAVGIVVMLRWLDRLHAAYMAPMPRQ